MTEALRYDTRCQGITQFYPPAATNAFIHERNEPHFTFPTMVVPSYHGQFCHGTLMLVNLDRSPEIDDIMKTRVIVDLGYK